MKREYIQPSIAVIELAAQAICQSVQQYQIAGDYYDSDSD
jgi:hypothetical protein